MRRLLLLAALAVAFLLGGVLGLSARRRARGGATEPRRRGPDLERAYAAWEAREPDRLRALLEGADPAEATEADRAEWALLAALASGAADRLDAVARRWPRSSAAAVAAWTLVERSADDAERAARVEAFRRVWPDAWVLSSARESGP